jgi:hypothetical protein
MSTSYGHDQDAEPPTPDGGEPAIVEAEDATSGDPSEDQDAGTPDARETQEPPD